jgi:cell division protein ZapA
MATASKQPPTDALTKPVQAKDVPAANAVNGSVRVEIFDQVYNLRGSDADYILKLAEYVDGKMRAVSEQTATVDSVRLAVLAALNIADEYHLLKRRLDAASPEARQRASKLASALDEVLQDTRRTG